MSHFDPAAFIRDYLAAVEGGATGAALARFYTEDAIQEEFPNQLVRDGARRTLADILAGAERGQQVTRRQTYEILTMIVNGDQAAIEVRWTATLAVPVGSIPAGGEMRARFGQFFVFRDGRIARQHNYDCFEPW